jgi:hypothetical protein
MTMWRIAAGAVLIAAGLTMGVRGYGWRRGVLLVLEGLARGALCAGPVWLATAIAGDFGGWCALPFAIAAGLIGKTPLEMLNFLLLQWLGVRVARSIEWTESDGTQVAVRGNDEQSVGQLADILAERRPRTRWFVLRWVWPLTGWWSEYRWIVNPRGVR